MTLCDPMDCSPPGFCPWDCLGRSPAVGCHFLLQGVFPTQGSYVGRWILYHCTSWETHQPLAWGQPTCLLLCSILSCSILLGFPGGSSGKEPARQCRRHSRRGSIPGSRRPPGGGQGNPLPFSCLENPTDRGVWQATVHRVTESDMTEAT